MIVVAAFLSLFIGLSLGLLGGGGSILTVPILRYVLGMEAHAAIAASLVVVGVTSAVATLPHARAGRVRWGAALAFGIAGMSGSFLAGRLAGLAPGGLLLSLFGLMMLATAFAMMRPRAADAEDEALASAPTPIAPLLASGLLVGAATGLVGAGGGFLIVPALVLYAKLPIRIAIGTSLAVIAMQSLAGALGHLGSVALDRTATLVVTLAALVGSVAGARLVGRVSPARLRAGFAWFVLAMALLFLGQEVPRALGASPPFVAVGAASVLATLALHGASQLARRARARAAIAPTSHLEGAPDDPP